VSTGEQTLDLQLDALTEAECGKVSTETAGGAKADRPVSAEVLTYLRAGDTLVVWRLDRLGRLLPHLIQTLTDLANRGVGFNSLTEQIDTTTPGGKPVFHVLGALAEFERDLTRERTHAGLAAARARDRIGDRPKALVDLKQIALAQAPYDGGQTDIETICRTLGVSRATLDRYISRSEGRQRAMKVSVKYPENDNHHPEDPRPVRQERGVSRCNSGDALPLLPSPFPA
jgi:DNA invertase Pin-like site-specific DNA recombinase